MTGAEPVRPLQTRLKQRLRRLLRPASPDALLRTLPVSDAHGLDRGTPIDRHYIHEFMLQHQADIRGSVLEVGDPRYTRAFGTNVTRSDVLDIADSNPDATIITDLTQADAIPPNTFDCFILSQTLHLLYDVPAAIDHAHRVLAAGGVLLATLPGVGRVANPGDGTTFWGFTAASCSRLFAENFDPGSVEVASYGNVLACIGRLAGLAVEDLSRDALDLNDPRFPLVITVRGVKS